MLRRSHLLIVLCVAVVGVPALVFALRFVQQDAYLPTGDIAIAELRLRATADTVLLLGPYTRWNAYHPGPIAYYALAPVFWLTGATAFSAHVSAIAVNLAALTAAVALARKLGGARLALLLTAAVALFLRAFRVEMLASPWNPALNLLPLVVAVLAAAAYAARATEKDRALIPLVVATTFVAQTHYGQAPIAVAIGIAALALGRRIPDRRTLAIAAAVLVVLWLPPLGQGDNLRDLASLETPGAQPIDKADALELVSRQFQLPPQWATARASRELTNPYGEQRSGLAALPFALLLLIPAWRLRRDDAAARALLLIATIAVAAGALATLAVRGTVFPWLYWWTGAAGMTWWVAVAYPLARRIPRPAAIPALATATAVAAIPLFFAAGTVDIDGLKYAAGLDAREPSTTIARAIADAAPRTDKVRITAADEDWGDPVAVTALELRRRGVDVRVSPAMRWPFGPELVGGAGWPALVFIKDGSPTLPPPDGRLVSTQPGYTVYAVGP